MCVDLERMIAESLVERAAYESVTIGVRDTDGSGMTYTIASLRRAMDMYHPGDDWKRPVDVVIPCESELLVCFTRAVEFFQGVRPTVRAVPGGEYGSVRVTSPGYVC